jgi:uncharacterized metal-binding protein YceD (DUF177 family)
MSETKLPWSVPVAFAHIPEDGRRFEIIAGEDTRWQLAKLTGLRTLPRLEATFQVTRQGARGLRVSGRVAATVGQVCVATLDPIENEVQENVSLVFALPSEPASEAGDVAAEGFDSNAAEPLVGNSIDLGAIATEFLILGIDPYPRKPGANLALPPVADAGAHPFAALAALKKGQGGKDE